MIEIHLQWIQDGGLYDCAKIWYNFEGSFVIKAENDWLDVKL